MNSILHPGESLKRETSYDVLFDDLNINQIIEKISSCWYEDISSLYHLIPEDIETEEYRNSIFKCIKNKEIRNSFEAFVSALNERERFCRQGELVESEDSKDVWFLREVHQYVSAVESLNESLNGTQTALEGLSELKKEISSYCDSRLFRALSEESASLYKELASYRIMVSYEEGIFSVLEGCGNGKYESRLSECFPESNEIFKSPYIQSGDLRAIEREAARILKKNHKEFFRKIGELRKEYRDYYSEFFDILKKELPYYLAFLRFEDKIKDLGYDFCTPERGEDAEALGLYDLALAIRIAEEYKKTEKVVANDVYLKDSERVFVLTGPNQGGKTTFARSLGQLVYFSKMGLDVPAYKAKVPFYTHICTHFSVEESTNSGKGKLVDELERLKPIMNSSKRKVFVVINELFTTAANYDAVIMGRRVIDHLCDMEANGIYVTHLYELSECNEKVVSLKAEILGNEERTYRIFRANYEEKAYSNTQVEKYKLTYEEIRERLG